MIIISSVTCNDVYRAIFYQNGTNILSTVFDTSDNSHVLTTFLNIPSSKI